MEKAIFFDLDGTLWDAIEPIKDSWNNTMERLGENYRYDYRTIKSIMGLTPEETLPITFYDSSKEKGRILFKECIHDEIESLKTHPGILYPKEKEVLSLLKQSYPLYIVSNADKGYVENFLSACQMKNYFRGYVQAGDTGLDKWQNILYLKEKEQIEDVIYVGDTNKDKTESEKAEVKFIHAAYGFGKIQDDQYRINTLEELPDLVKRLFDEV